MKKMFYNIGTRAPICPSGCEREIVVKNFFLEICFSFFQQNLIFAEPSEIFDLTLKYVFQGASMVLCLPSRGPRFDSCLSTKYLYPQFNDLNDIIWFVIEL